MMWHVWELEEGIQVEQRRAGGWKVRTRHQTSEDKSRILQGLEGDIRGCRFDPIVKKDEPCEPLRTGVKWSHLCFRIIWKQTARVNCSWLQ